MQAAFGEPSASRHVAPLKGVGQVRSAEAQWAAAAGAPDASMLS